MKGKKVSPNHKNEAAIFSTLKQVERFIKSAYLLDGCASESLKFLLGSKASFNAFKRFIQDQDTLFFYLSVKSLNCSFGGANWHLNARRMYNYHISAETSQLRIKIPQEIYDGLVELFTNSELASELDVPKFQSSETSACTSKANVHFKLLEVFALDSLCKYLPNFLNSRPYQLWRCTERGRGVAVCTLDNIAAVELRERAAKEEKLRINRANITNGNKRFSLVRALESRLYGEQLSNSVSETYQEVVCDESITNMHAVDSEPWLTVLLLALESLPIGLALHSVQRELPDFLNMDTSNTKETIDGGRNLASSQLMANLQGQTPSSKLNQMKIKAYPYLYANRYYLKNCGGFSASEMKDQAHDFMYMFHNHHSSGIDSTNRRNHVLRSDETRSTTQSLEKVEKKDDGGFPYVNNLSAISNSMDSNESSEFNRKKQTELKDVSSLYMEDVTQRDAVKVVSSRLVESQVKSEEQFDFHYCSSDNIDVLQQAMSACEQITTSIPMKSKFSTGSTIAGGYVNVLAWKPLMGPVNTKNSEENSIKQKSQGSQITTKEELPIPSCYESMMRAFASIGLAGAHHDKAIDKLYMELVRLEEEPPEEAEPVLEIKYYLCLQRAVPVKNIQRGLTLAEVELARVTVKELDELIDIIPASIDPINFGRPNNHKT